jgi:alpha-1,6-mannosyltransferase
VHLVDITMFYPAQTGGVGTYLRAKAQWLREYTTIRHTVVAPVRRGVQAPELVSLPSLPLPWSCGFRWPLSSAIATRSLLRLAPDLIEAGDPYQCAWSALEASRRLRVPAIAFHHSDLPQLVDQRFGRIARVAAERYIAQLYKRFDLVLAPSQCCVSALRALGVRNARWQALGVDTGIFTPTARDGRLRERLGLSPSTRLLVYAGRFTREKNLPALVGAVQRLGAPYHLLLIGSGRLMHDPSHVTRLPFETDPHRLAASIASCDLFVHPGAHETFGLVVLESMACGVPVLGVAQGGVGELIDDRCGLLVERGDADSLAAGIAALFESDLLKLGLQARIKAEHEHDWRCVLPQLVHQYQHLAGVRAAPAGEPLGLPP